MRHAVLLCLVVACGSSNKGTQPRTVKDAEREAADAREKEIEAMKPASPYERREQRVFRTTERCGQGPYRIETESLRAKYGERLYVYACGKHAISGNYRLTTTRKGQSPNSSESKFGFWSEGVENSACKAREAVAVTSGGSSSGGGKGSGKQSSNGGTTSAAPTTIQPVSLVEAGGAVPTDCTQTHVLDHTYTAWKDGIALDARVAIDLWSAEPNDLEGLVFVVEKHGVVADMTIERWQAYEKANDAYYDARRAYVDGEIKSGRSRILDTKVKTPPPPPARAEVQPPKPSKNARWIPGYWHYEETKFHWIAGLWDVPDEDVKQELTVSAPTPPPAEPAVEQPVEPQPTRTAVWTPGSWQWNGRAYIWVAGAWRIPPAPQSTWRRATWSVSGGRAVYVPGGWRVNVRIGR